MVKDRDPLMRNTETPTGPAQNFAEEGMRPPPLFGNNIDGPSTRDPTFTSYDDKDWELYQDYQCMLAEQSLVDLTPLEYLKARLIKTEYGGVHAVAPHLRPCVETIIKLQDAIEKKRPMVDAWTQTESTGESSLSLSSTDKKVQVKKEGSKAVKTKMTKTTRTTKGKARKLQPTLK